MLGSFVLHGAVVLSGLAGLVSSVESNKASSDQFQFEVVLQPFKIICDDKTWTSTSTTTKTHTIPPSPDTTNPPGPGQPNVPPAQVTTVTVTEGCVPGQDCKPATISPPQGAPSHGLHSSLHYNCHDFPSPFDFIYSTGCRNNCYGKLYCDDVLSSRNSAAGYRLHPSLHNHGDYIPAPNYDFSAGFHRDCYVAVHDGHILPSGDEHPAVPDNPALYYNGHDLYTSARIFDLVLRRVFTLSNHLRIQVMGSIPVTPGQSLRLIAGGQGGITSFGISAYGNGGSASSTAGGGGGASALYNGDTLLAVAGGGGGGSGSAYFRVGGGIQVQSEGSNTNSGDAGFAGGTRYFYQSGQSPPTTYTSLIGGGRPGTSSSAGAGGVFDGTYAKADAGSSGNSHAGGAGAAGASDSSGNQTGPTVAGGGGGGGGYYGGGGGSSVLFNDGSRYHVSGAKGGGGSSYVNSAVDDSSQDLVAGAPGSVVVVFS
ncbi:hypothetical protein LIA77_00072 [Sarocladium implicatum]|nr:hypothetical protein LIA77_00072 [Sarocladium implicatum]